jgi:PAS domain S-box-containing protein
MKDDIKTKKQLIEELAELRLQNAALNQSTTEGISAGLAIEEARRYAESIVETVREPLLVLDADLKIISANRNFYKAFKVTSVETIGSFIYDLGNKQWDIPKLRELLEEVLPEKQAFNDFEVKHNFEDIGQKIMLLNARQIHQEYIDAKIILLAIEDITERKLVEEKLRIAAIVESSKDAIIGKSLDGIITSWDKGAEEIYGYTKSEIIGKSVSVLIPPELPDEMAEILEKIKSGEGIKNYETVRQRKDGQDIYVSMTVSAIHDAEGRILGASIVARDITERNRLEHLLEESEMQYRLLFETANDGIVLLEKNEGKIVHVNPSVEKMLGYSAKESIGNKLQNVGLIIDNGDFQITMKNLNEKGILRYYDVPVKTKSGHHIYADTYIVDKAKFAQCNIRDITERRKAEEKIHNITERLHLATVSAKAGVWDWNLQTNEMIWDDRMIELYGLTRENFHGGIKAWEQGLHPDDSSRAIEECQAALRGEQDFDTDFRVLHPDGVVVNIKANGLVLRDEEGKPLRMIGLNIDITERKRQEKQLQDTLESIRKAVNTTIQVMISTIEARDPYTSGHQSRSADLARAIATEMGLPQEQIEGLRMAGSIHDIGKLSIPAEILSKPTKLSDLEFSMIKEHARKGYEMLKDVESPWSLAEIVYQHHERMDGSGYPRNLKEGEILMEARILSVADVVEAMASHRPYRAGLGINAALDEIEQNKGILYDPVVADACLKLFREKDFQLERA